MRIIRSTLAVKVRSDRRGQSYYVARGYVPERRADGSVISRRVEHRLAGDTRAAREEEVAILSLKYEEAARTEGMTFARAYLNYIALGHPVPAHAETILQEIGMLQAARINTTIMVELTEVIFDDVSPVTVNRHLYTPVLAILKKALGNAAPMIPRPCGYRDVIPMVIPDDSWFAAVLPHMRPTTRALVLFLTLHGRRLTDALGRRPEHFDAEAHTLIIDKTKTGDPLLVQLHPKVVDAMQLMPQNRQWLFGDGPTSGSNVRADIRTAATVAGLPYYTPHQLGRHAFATRMLRAGYSLQYVKDAGGWKTIEMVAKRYGHLERKEVSEAVLSVGDKFVGAHVNFWGGALTAPSSKEPSLARIPLAHLSQLGRLRRAALYPAELRVLARVA